MASSLTSPSTPTSEPSIRCPGAAKSTSSQVGSPASRSALLASSSAKRTRATSGPRQTGSFAKWDPTSRCWRTFQSCFITGTSAEYSETWPRAGTGGSGIVSQRSPLVPATSGTGSSSLRSRVEPTWPKSIRTLVESLGLRYLPTPLKSDATRAGGLKDPKRWARKRGRPYDLKLCNCIRGPVNPAWVEWLMAWPEGWTALQPLEMDKFRSWLQRQRSYLRALLWE